MDLDKGVVLTFKTEWDGHQTILSEDGCKEFFKLLDRTRDKPFLFKLENNSFLFFTKYIEKKPYLVLISIKKSFDIVSTLFVYHEITDDLYMIVRKLIYNVQYFHTDKRLKSFYSELNLKINFQDTFVKKEGFYDGGQLIKLALTDCLQDTNMNINILHLLQYFKKVDKKIFISDISKEHLEMSILEMFKIDSNILIFLDKDKKDFFIKQMEGVDKFDLVEKLSSYKNEINKIEEKILFEDIRSLVSEDEDALYYIMNIHKFFMEKNYYQYCTYEVIIEFLVYPWKNKNIEGYIESKIIELYTSGNSIFSYNNNLKSYHDIYTQFSKLSIDTRNKIANSPLKGYFFNNLKEILFEIRIEKKSEIKDALQCVSLLNKEYFSSDFTETLHEITIELVDKCILNLGVENE